MMRVIYSLHSFFFCRYQFLAPNLYLDPEHRGKIYIPQLDLKRICSNTPLSSPDIIPFLLRRNNNYQLSSSSSMKLLIHSLALYRLYCMIITQTPLSIIKSAWMNNVIDTYSKKCNINNNDHNNNKYNVVLGWDMEACIPLIFQCVLLPRRHQHQHQQEQSDNYHDSNNSRRNEVRPFEEYLKSFESGICPQPPCICNCILTQVQIIEKVLLPLAIDAIQDSNSSNTNTNGKRNDVHDKLNFIAEVACLFMSVLYRNSTPCCVALECLIVAIYWKLGYGKIYVSLYICALYSTCTLCSHTFIKI